MTTFRNPKVRCCIYKRMLNSIREWKRFVSMLLPTFRNPKIRNIWTSLDKVLSIYVSNISHFCITVLKKSVWKLVPLANLALFTCLIYFLLSFNFFIPFWSVFFESIWIIYWNIFIPFFFIPFWVIFSRIHLYKIYPLYTK